MPVPLTLAAWAIDVAYPYLEANVPGGYHPDTTDPRDGRYDDSDDDMDDADDDGKPAATVESAATNDEGWTLMGPNGKPVLDLPLSPPPASSDPPPASPVPPLASTVPTPDSTVPHSASTVPPPASTVPHSASNVPPAAQMPPTDPRSPPKPPTPMRLNLDKSTSHNDGTLVRVSVKWSPLTYTQLIPTTSKTWATQATDILHFLFITAPDCCYHTWDTKATQTVLPMLSLTPDNLSEFLSPTVTAMDSKSMFAFGVRVSMCGGGSPGPWINNQATQAAMFNNRADLSISNTTSDSGEIVVAGYILLKDPTLTHRQYYVTSLRNELPMLPFFDLGVHRKSTQGDDIPHLVVRCGEKVVDQLSANLSVHLNGTISTAIYISREHMMNAPAEEISGIYGLHNTYLNTAIRISMSPHITHLDRIFAENHTAEHPQMDRSTRQWANALKDSHGNSLQCDVKCGANNRQVYLLVPAHHETQARLEITSYLSRLAQLRPSTVLNYQPKAAIITNVTFLRTMTQSNQWTTTTSAFPAPPPRRSGHPAAPPLSKPQNLRDDSMSAGTGVSASTSQQTPLSKFNYTRRGNDDQATATKFASDSKTARFNAMEANILHHQTAIQRHQSAFKSVHERFDVVEDQAIRTMEVCEASSKSLLELRQDSFQQMSALRSESAQSIQALRDESTASQTHIQSQLSSLQDLLRTLLPQVPQPTPSDSSSRTSSSSSSSNSSLMSTTTHQTTSAPVPPPQPPSVIHQPTTPSDVKKRDLTNISHPDQASAQYKSPRAPDGKNP